MPKKIPIKQAKAFAIANDLKQVIIAGWDGERTHIVTYGDTVEACDQAALGGNKIKKALGWPADLDAEPSRVSALKARVTELENIVAAQFQTIKELEAQPIQEIVKPKFKVHLVERFQCGVNVVSSKSIGFVAVPSKELVSAFILQSNKFYAAIVPKSYVQCLYVGQYECSEKFYEALNKLSEKRIFLTSRSELTE